MAAAISAACVSSAKWPVSKKRTGAPGMSRRIERDVALVVAEQIELDLIGAGARQIEVVERQSVGRDRRLVSHAMGILPSRRFRREEGAERRAIGLRRLLPVSSNWVPALAQPFFVGVAILRDDCGDAVGMFDSDPKACRRAIVEDIDRKA